MCDLHTIQKAMSLMNGATGLWTTCSVLYYMMAPLHPIGSTKFHPSCWPLILCLINNMGTRPPWSWQVVKTLFPSIWSPGPTLPKELTVLQHMWPAFLNGEEMHWQVAPTRSTTRPNPCHPSDLIWVSTPPLERTFKLIPKWMHC